MPHNPVKGGSTLQQMYKLSVFGDKYHNSPITKDEKVQDREKREDGHALKPLEFALV